MYHQYTTDRTGIQTVQAYSTVQVYGTVQEICTVQVYRQYRFTRQVYYWCSTNSTGLLDRCTTGVETLSLDSTEAGEELMLITQLGLSYIEDRCRTGVGQV